MLVAAEPPRKPVDRGRRRCYVDVAVLEIEEVVRVKASTWVLLGGVVVGR
jgi:hypothetical protein